MNKLVSILLIFFINISCAQSQNKQIDKSKLKEDLDIIISNISQNYIYLEDKNIDLECVREYYETKIEEVETIEESVLFFEYFLDEFYDNHLTLTANVNSSFRLFAPIYVEIRNDRPIITNVWQSQIENLEQDLIGAEILKFNGIDFQEAINNFPTHCNDKSLLETKEWIANKIVAGRYDQSRGLSLKLSNGKEIDINLDNIKLKENNGLLTSSRKNDIGIIRINNSLGNSDLVSLFDETLTDLFDTKGLIIDLRNTIFGGNTYEARGIMGRFIVKPKPYQRHSYIESSQNNPDVERSWVEYVTPRLEAYQKPVVILVGRWTGSMGEGIAIGFEGMGRAEIVGTEMRRLAGEVADFSFEHRSYGYKIPTTKLFHVNEIIREEYVPMNYVNQSTTDKDEILNKGLKLINEMTQ